MKVYEVLFGDATACIVMSVRNEQIDSIQKGKYVSIKGAKSEVYRGSMKLVLPKAVEIKPADQLKLNPQLGFNMSQLEFTAVKLPEQFEEQEYEEELAE